MAVAGLGVATAGLGHSLGLARVLAAGVADSVDYLAELAACTAAAELAPAAVVRSLGVVLHMAGQVLGLGVAGNQVPAGTAVPGVAAGLELDLAEHIAAVVLAAGTDLLGTMQPLVGQPVALPAAPERGLPGRQPGSVVQLALPHP